MSILSRLHVRCRSFRGFTLVELLVVVAIIAILAMLLMGALKKAMATGRNTRCRSNLHQLHSMGMATATDFIHFGFPAVGTLATSSITNQSVFVCPFDRRAPGSKTLISYIGGGSGINIAGGNETTPVYLDDKTTVYSHEPKRIVRNVVYADGHVGTISNNN